MSEDHHQVEKQQHLYMSDCPRCGAKRLYDRACPQCGFPPHYPMHHSHVLSDEEVEEEANEKF
jgi:ribosomal protein L32